MEVSSGKWFPVWEASIYQIPLWYDCVPAIKNETIHLTLRGYFASFSERKNIDFPIITYEFVIHASRPTVWHAGDGAWKEDKLK